MPWWAVIQLSLGLVPSDLHNWMPGAYLFLSQGPWFSSPADIALNFATGADAVAWGVFGFSPCVEQSLFLSRSAAQVELTKAMVMEKPSSLPVRWESVRQYYTLLNQAADMLHRLYGKNSSYVHGGLDSNGKPADAVYGQKEIHRKVMSQNFTNCHTKIRHVDTHATLNDGVVVQVMGLLSNNNQALRTFMRPLSLLLRALLQISFMFTMISSDTKMRSLVALSLSLRKNLKKKQRNLKKDSRHLRWFLMILELSMIKLSGKENFVHVSRAAWEFELFSLSVCWRAAIMLRIISENSDNFPEERVCFWYVT